MALVLVLAVVLVLVAAAASSVTTALRLLWNGRLARGRWWWILAVLLGLGVAVGLYGSFGLVPVSSTTRYLGFPLPYAGFERGPDGQWRDYVGSPLLLLFVPCNFILWTGLWVAPITLPAWWRRRVARRQET